MTGAWSDPAVRSFWADSLHCTTAKKGSPLSRLLSTARELSWAEDRQDEQQSKRAGQQADILYLTDMSRSLNSER